MKTFMSLDIESINSWVILYIIFVLLGFLVRVAFISSTTYDISFNRKKTFIQIVITIIFTFIWDSVKDISYQRNFMAMAILTSIMIYIIVGGISNANDYDNSLSIINFISGYFITALSFMALPWNAIVAIIVILIDIIYVRINDKVPKSQLCEVVILSAEAVLISIVMHFLKLESPLEIIYTIIFIETVIYSINIFITLIVLAIS